MTIESGKRKFGAVIRLQSAVVGIILGSLLLMLWWLYWADRQQEWRLREEQANHRLDLAFELIDRDFDRVRADILYIANQAATRGFDFADPQSREKVEREFSNFLLYKNTYQQIRIIDLKGLETARVNYSNNAVQVIPTSQLQDKKDRYYVRESLTLRPDEVYVSEFDLNQERGQIEKPLVPVIRFVTPICDAAGNVQNLLVANYLGGPLLRELKSISLPGRTLLTRGDGGFLLGVEESHSWGWLLNHSRSFVSQFPEAWANPSRHESKCFLDSEGAFAFRKISLHRFRRDTIASKATQNELWLVSYLPPSGVFERSDQLLWRLILWVTLTLLPLLWITRLWAAAAIRRREQAELILQSEKKLRSLSSRLVVIQEEERRAISREIHDQIGQQVTAINLDLKLMQRDAASDSIDSQLQRAIDESEQLLETLHDFATRIRPVELDDLGLHDAVESHIDEFRIRSGIDVAFHSSLDGIELSSVISENVYRLIQESLNNILKHSSASEVWVRIKVDEESDQFATGGSLLTIEVQDNGVGVNEVVDSQTDSGEILSEKSRLGILGMRERVDLLGGVFELESHPQSGTKITVKVPIK